MFIEKGFVPENRFWKYLLGSFIVFIAAQCGQIPWFAAIAVDAVSSGRTFPNTTDAVMRFLPMNTTLFFLLISFAFALLALVIIVKKLHHQPFKDIVTTRKKTDWGRVLFAFTLWGIFSAGSVLLAYYTEPGKYIYQFNWDKFLILALIAVPLIPIQTSVEELVFRGYLMQGFGLLAKNRWFPLMMTSLIFGLMHIANPEVGKIGYIITLFYIGTGLLLGIMTLMDEGTELALGFHAANNLTAALMVTADWTAFRTPSVFKDVSEPSAGWDIFVPLIVIYPIILLIFSKKYKWHSWKERLTGEIKIPQQDNTPPNTNITL
ncbi:MAG: CPBP family intramembrane glutamic endopeptidase [Flavobacterium sp.]